MASDITYQVMSSAPGTITVRYTMGAQTIDLPISWDGKGDLATVVGQYTPRTRLTHMATPAADLSSFVGQTGNPMEPADIAAAAAKPAS